MDLVGQLRQDRGLTVEVAETKGLIGFLRFNFLFPPFDNQAIRRAVLQAVRQKDYMQAVVGETPPMTTMSASSPPAARWPAGPGWRRCPASTTSPR